MFLFTPGRFSTTHTWETWRSMQDIFCKFKISSHFPNFDDGNAQQMGHSFDASTAWQIGHNSQEDCLLELELVLDFAAWINLTLNVETC